MSVNPFVCAVFGRNNLALEGCAGEWALQLWKHAGIKAPAVIPSLELILNLENVKFRNSTRLVICRFPW
jgi:hypothetical protein